MNVPWTCYYRPLILFVPLVECKGKEGGGGLNLCPPQPVPWPGQVVELLYYCGTDDTGFQKSKSTSGNSEISIPIPSNGNRMNVQTKLQF